MLANQNNCLIYSLELRIFEKLTVVKLRSMFGLLLLYRTRNVTAAVA
jgi:TfoX/Sxy family transcriptional regulator of competence genes